MTRDSVFFSWWAVGLAILAWLATGGDPRTWDYLHWINALIAIGTIIQAKLGISPLPHSTDSTTVKVTP